MFKILYEELNAEFNIQVGFNDDSHFKNEPVLLDGYKKVRGGIQYFVQRYQQFDLNVCYQDIAKHGYFSKRPYQLAQPCDASIDSCVLALYYKFCQAKRLSPYKLLSLAYPDENVEDYNFATIKKMADWQGVAYPVRWSKKAFEGLLESLTEINYHSLVNVMADINLIDEC